MRDQLLPSVYGLTPNHALHSTALPPRLHRSGRAAGELERSAVKVSLWMSPQEQLLLESLDALLQSDAVRAGIEPIVERVQRKLAQDRAAAMAWEPIPLSIYEESLPAFIRSSWVLYCGRGTPPEQSSADDVFPWNRGPSNRGRWTLAVQPANQQSGSGVGAEVGYDTTKRPASSNCRGFRLGGCLVPDRVGRRVDRSPRRAEAPQGCSAE